LTLVLAITSRSSKNKDELPATRIGSATRFIEVAFLSGLAIDFFAHKQFLDLQDWYLASGQNLEPIDAAVQGNIEPLPGTSTNTLATFVQAVATPGTYPCHVEGELNGPAQLHFPSLPN